MRLKFTLLADVWLQIPIDSKFHGSEQFCKSHLDIVLYIANWYIRTGVSFFVDLYNLSLLYSE